MLRGRAPSGVIPTLHELARPLCIRPGVLRKEWVAAGDRAFLFYNQPLHDRTGALSIRIRFAGVGRGRSQYSRVMLYRMARTPATPRLHLPRAPSRCASSCAVSPLVYVLKWGVSLAAY